jgi:endonuclease YncB( thermonuclease family)
VTGTIRVIDGDTIDVGTERIRLHGIDAPERGQPCVTRGGQDWACGDWVTRQVRDLYQGAQARCRQTDRDRYGRIVATCDVNGQDMGRTLVQSGIAFAYERFSRAYVADEARARRAALGIHGFDMESPARYRTLQTSGQNTSGSGCRIKGNISKRGERIYHLPGQAFYDKTRIHAGKGERWFCSEAQAKASGWRRAKR